MPAPCMKIKGSYMIVEIMQIYTWEGKETHEKIHTLNKISSKEYSSKEYSVLNPKVMKRNNTEELKQFWIDTDELVE